MKLIAILIFSFLLTGCFHARCADDIPPQLRTLYLDTRHPDQPLATELRRQLQALHVQWATTPQTASAVLHILSVEWEESIYPILYSGNATTYTYTMKTTISLQTPQGKTIVGPKTLTISRPLTKNANQIYTPNASILMKQELTHTMVTLIYHYLISLKLH